MEEEEGRESTDKLEADPKSEEGKKHFMVLYRAGIILWLWDEIETGSILCVVWKKDITYL